MDKDYFGELLELAKPAGAPTPYGLLTTITYCGGNHG